MTTAKRCAAHALIVCTTAVAAACAGTVIQPAAPQPRVPVPVVASFSKTWTAAVDVFADKNIGIRTIDKASGLIVADPVRVATPRAAYENTAPSSLADCGSRKYAGSTFYGYPTSATYNVRVRGDSTASTVQVTVRWDGIPPGKTFGPPENAIDCSSTGNWESVLEAAVKGKAEKP